MAESGVMQSFKQVRIFQVPTAAVSGWRAQIAEACARAGWEYAEIQAGETLDDFNDNSVVVGWFSDTGDARAHWIVHTASPSHVLDLLINDGFDEREAVYHAGLRLAIASTVAERGAAVAYQSDPILKIPGLGHVEAVGGGSSACANPRAAAFALYDRLPTLPGKRVAWGVDMFTYEKDTQGDDRRIELLGRRRLLFNGPNIALPPGVWIAKARFKIEPQDMADLFIEWGHGADAVYLRHEFVRAGKYELTLSRTWTKVEPADFRISIMTSALAGWLELDEVIVERAPDN